MHDRHEKAFEAIRSLCADFAARYGLDADIRDELCGHLEDQVSGYLSGQIPLSPEDAVLLAKAHFGDLSGVCAAMSGGRELRDSRQAGKPRLISSIAALTGVLMFLGLPACALGLGATFRAALEMVAGIAVLEAGVLLAVHADLQSRWQRAVAAVLLLPTIALTGALLTSPLGPVSLQPPIHLAEVQLTISLTAFLALLGHLALFILMCRPQCLELRTQDSPLAIG